MAPVVQLDENVRAAASPEWCNALCYSAPRVTDDLFLGAAIFTGLFHF
jgi:hypothetical protein